MLKPDIVRWWILSMLVFFAVRVFAAEFGQAKAKPLSKSPRTYLGFQIN